MTESENLSWLEKVKSVIVSPSEFFENMATDAGYESPLIFAAINLVIVSVLAGILTYAMSSIIGGMFLGQIPGLSSGMLGLMGVIMVPVMIVTTLIGGIIGLFIGAAIVHILLMIVGGKGSYEGTFRVGAYTTAFLLISWIPIVNIIVALYAFYVAIVGYSKVHSVSKGKAFVALLIPLIIFMGISFMLGGLGQTMGPLSVVHTMAQ